MISTDVFPPLSYFITMFSYKKNILPLRESSDTVLIFNILLDNYYHAKI